MKYVSVLALLFLMLLASCANRAQTGAAGGAAAGALIGQAIGHEAFAPALDVAVAAIELGTNLGPSQTIGQ